jgi:hypothetical protein
MTVTDRPPASTTTKPNLSIDELKARFSNVREPIVVALHILLQEADITIENAKEAAKAYGVRITRASVAAAQRLKERMDTAPAMPAAPTDAAPATPTRPARRPRAAEPNQDAEGLVRGLVAKLQAQGNADAERLRNAIRRAVDLLNAALA